MTTIQASINISGTTTPLTGFIRVISEASFNDGSVNNDYNVPVAKDYTLVSGVVSFDLDPSDVARVAYKFEIWQTVPDLEDPENPGVFIPQPGILLKTFSAIVPFSATPIQFKDLATQTGVRYDAQDAALITLARYLYQNDTFWSFLADQVFRNQGDWVNTTFYKRGDVVLFNGSSYQYINTLATNNQVPTNTTYWRPLALKGDTGTGTNGNDTAYGVSWNGSTDAPSRNVVYDIIQTLATQAQLGDYATLAGSPVFTGNPQRSVNNLTADNSTNLATTGFVQDNLALLGTIEVGTLAVWSTTSAPSRWRIITNPGEVLSQTTYADLFALWNTTYNTSGEGAGNFRAISSSTLPTLSNANCRWIVYTGV